MRLAARLAALVALAVAMLVWLRHDAALARLMFVDLHMNDFGKVYYAARHFLAGQDMYAASPATAVPVGPGVVWSFWNLNAPHVHLIVLPMAWLPPAPAIAAWAAANLAALAASVRVIVGELRVPWTPALALTLLAIVALSSATGAVAATGQLTALLLWPVTLAWRAARTGDWRRAAVWLGVAVSLKLFLAVFALFFVVRRRFDAVLVMTAVVAVAFAAGLVVFGAANHVAWLEALGRVDWTWAAMNGSITGLVARTLGPSPYFTPLALRPELVPVLAIAGSLAVLVATLAAVRRPADGPGGGPAADAMFAALVLAALLASPLGWIYYLPLAAGPLCVLWRERWAPRWRDARQLAWIALALPGLVIPISVTVWRGDLAWYTATVGSAYAWTTVALWWAAVRCLPAPDRTAA